MFVKERGSLSQTLHDSDGFGRIEYSCFLEALAVPILVRGKHTGESWYNTGHAHGTGAWNTTIGIYEAVVRKYGTMVAVECLVGWSEQWTPEVAKPFVLCEV